MCQYLEGREWGGGQGQGGVRTKRMYIVGGGGGGGGL